MGDVRSVRQILDEMGYSTKVPQGCELVRQKIGPRVKLHIVPKVKEQRPGDANPVNYYEEKDWELIKTIVRVTVAEHMVERTAARPKRPFEVNSSIFGTEHDGSITINSTNTTKAYLFPLLSSRDSKRLKQSFESEAERTAYKKRIVALLNAIWVETELREPLDVDAEPYLWCGEKTGNVDKVIADLTEIVRYEGQFVGTTLEDIAVECKVELDNKAARSQLHYILEKLIGYKVYKRVIKKEDTGVSPTEDLVRPNDEWSPIVLTRKEAQMIKGLYIIYNMPEPVSMAVNQTVVASCADEMSIVSTSNDPDAARSSKLPRLQ
jgi:hypothetical protein